MNRGLLGFPKGRELSPGLLGWPLGQDESAIPRTPPVTDYDAWWDASDFSTLTIVSDLVSQWNDKSAGGFNLSQGTAGNRPGYGASRLRRINGITILDFDGGDFMDSALAATSSSFTWAFVADTGVLSAFSGIIIGSTVSSAAEVHVGGGAPADGELVLHHSGADVAGMQGVLVHRPFAAVTANDATTVFYNLNKSTYSQTRTVSRAGNHRVGNNNASQLLTGGIGEILIWNRCLDSSERQETCDYLINKWGVS